jgi:hypothetical protein
MRELLILGVMFFVFVIIFAFFHERRCDSWNVYLPRWLKILFWTAVFVISLKNFINDISEKRDAIKRQQQQIVAYKESAIKMTQEWNADTDWTNKLKNGISYRESNILTYELEKVWKNNHLIFFNGFIVDISNHDEKNYKILIERPMYAENQYIFTTCLQLQLIAKKTKIDEIKKSHTSILDTSFNKNLDRVSVIAKIQEIESYYTINEENRKIESKVGKGNLIDIIYTGSANFD